MIKLIQQNPWTALLAFAPVIGAITALMIAVFNQWTNWVGVNF